MAMIPTYDFGTVRLYEVNGIIEAYFPRNDTATRQAVKTMKGFFDGDRKAWRITPRFARMETGGVVASIREALEKSAPEGWLKALPTLRRLAATTRQFSIKLGEGGMRVELPPGHKHDWTLKNVQGASKDGASWLVPAQFCAEKVVKGVINDVMLDDRKALAEAIDYLDGFVFSGDLDLTPGEAETLGLAAGGVVFSDPSFVRTADPGLGPEPLYEYPFKVRSFDVVRSEETGDERYSAKLSVLCGNAGWTALRTRFCSPMDARTLPLDGRHVKGKWVRRRG